ncbi:hypothetical protein [Streptomyces chartreusis]|uniref:hypothetical protein n=1 Tax=Streptomyces chartreusis TaxID=1969 RepID=UPI003827D9FB
MMRASFATQAGGANPNEDWAAATPTIAIVLDGLSTVGLETGCRHGVPWYVANLGGNLVAALSDPTRSLAEGFSIALESVAALHPECDLANPGTPSSTVSILREAEDSFSYLVLADSPIALEGKNGVTVVTDLAVERVVVDLKEETQRYATGTPEHTESLRRMVTAQRKMRNVEGGYWVAAADPRAAEHAVTGEISRSELRSAAVLSDGASRLVTEYAATTWPQAFAMLRAGGPQALIDAVRKVEATDPDGVRWPRYKSGDDAAVVYCQP